MSNRNVEQWVIANAVRQSYIVFFLTQRRQVAEVFDLTIEGGCFAVPANDSFDVPWRAGRNTETTNEKDRNMISRPLTGFAQDRQAAKTNNQKPTTNNCYTMEGMEKHGGLSPKSMRPSCTGNRSARVGFDRKNCTTHLLGYGSGWHLPAQQGGALIQSSHKEQRFENLCGLCDLK